MSKLFANWQRSILAAVLGVALGAGSVSAGYYVNYMSADWGWDLFHHVYSGPTGYHEYQLYTWSWSDNSYPNATRFWLTDVEYTGWANYAAYYGPIHVWDEQGDVVEAYTDIMCTDMRVSNPYLTLNPSYWVWTLGPTNRAVIYDTFIHQLDCPEPTWATGHSSEFFAQPH